nr:hypothetical protein [Desulfobulbaceae bacterium]
MTETSATTPASQANIVAQVHEALAKVKAAARVKQRTVENLIESAQAAHGKVLQKFNDHIDLLEHEKVRLAKEAEDSKDAQEKAEVALLDAKESVLAMKKEMVVQKEEHSRAVTDLTKKNNDLKKEKEVLVKRVGSLEKDVEGNEKKIQALTAELETSKDVEKSLKKEIAETAEKHSAELKKRNESHKDAIEDRNKKAKEQADKDLSAIEILKKQNGDLTTERDALAKNVLTLEAAVDNMKDEKEQIKNSLSNQIAELSEKQASLVSEKEAMQDKLEQFQRAWDNMES